MRLRSIVALGVGLISAAAWAATAAPPPPLDILHHKYLPPTVTVPKGTTVKWVNHDEDTHTVTSATGLFASTAIEPEQTFTHTFSEPGTYAYFCALHPLMKATITVK
jgi:plastocyanin